MVNLCCCRLGFFLSFQISAIRSVVPNKSNNEIVLVLQQFDNNVDKAVQAFMDGEYSILSFTKARGINLLVKVFIVSSDSKYILLFC